MPAVMLGIVVVVNTILALSENVVDWWSRENDPTSSSLPKVVQELLEVRPANSSGADPHLLMRFVAIVVQSGGVSADHESHR